MSTPPPPSGPPSASDAANDHAAPPTATAPAPSPAAPAPALPPTPTEPPMRSSGRASGPWRALALALVALAAGGALFGLYALHGEVTQLRTALADGQRSLATVGEVAAQRERDAQLKIERLQSEVERLRDQRAELDQLYLDLTRGRDEAALVEVERLVTMASQELQITGSVPTALAALQGADARLARIDRPQLVNLRRAITRDIERLRAAPAVDITGLALKIDQIAQGVDALPLLADAAPRQSPPVTAAGKAEATKSDGTADASLAGWWSGVRAWLQQEFGDLVRIREVDTPEALLLTGAQQQLVRQQLRLRLLNARQALLARNDKLYRADLSEAQALLARYFDARQGTVVTAQTQLKQLAAAPLSVDLPQLTESVAALRGLRAGAR